LTHVLLFKPFKHKFFLFDGIQRGGLANMFSAWGTQFKNILFYFFSFSYKFKNLMYQVYSLRYIYVT